MVEITINTVIMVINIRINVARYCVYRTYSLNFSKRSVYVSKRNRKRVNYRQLGCLAFILAKN